MAPPTQMTASVPLSSPALPVPTQPRSAFLAHSAPGSFHHLYLHPVHPTAFARLIFTKPWITLTREPPRCARHNITTAELPSLAPTGLPNMGPIFFPSCTVPHGHLLAAACALHTSWPFTSNAYSTPPPRTHTNSAHKSPPPVLPLGGILSLHLSLRTTCISCEVLTVPHRSSKSSSFSKQQKSQEALSHRLPGRIDRKQPERLQCTRSPIATKIQRRTDDMLSTATLLSTTQTTNTGA